MSRHVVLTLEDFFCIIVYGFCMVYFVLFFFFCFFFLEGGGGV